MAGHRGLLRGRLGPMGCRSCRRPSRWWTPWWPAASGTQTTSCCASPHAAWRSAPARRLPTPSWPDACRSISRWWARLSPLSATRPSNCMPCRPAPAAPPSSSQSTVRSVTRSASTTRRTCSAPVSGPTPRSAALCGWCCATASPPFPASSTRAPRAGPASSRCASVRTRPPARGSRTTCRSATRPTRAQ